MSWNHRIIKHKDGDGYCYGIHEVHYEDNNPSLCTIKPLVVADDILELETAYLMIHEAFDRPILDAEIFGESEAEK